MGKRHHVGVTKADTSARVNCPSCGDFYGEGSFAVYVQQGKKNSVLGQMTTKCCGEEVVLLVFSSKGMAEAKSKEVLTQLSQKGSRRKLTLIPVDENAFS